MARIPQGNSSWSSRVPRGSGVPQVSDVPQLSRVPVRPLRAPRLRVLFPTLLVLVALLAAGYAFTLYANAQAISAEERMQEQAFSSGISFEVEDAAESPEVIAAAAEAAKRKVTLSFTGDCILGNDEAFGYSGRFPEYYDNNGPDYFFQNVRSLFEEDDVTVVNMENPLTNETARVDKEFSFKGPPEYASVLTGSSVEAANLANNHTSDYGYQSYWDTVDALEGGGILSYGYDRVQIIERNGVKVGLVGAYALVGEGSAAEELQTGIAAVKEQGADVVVATVHWGEERAYYPSESQQYLAHLAIDEGADLVVGHHPHVLQGQETYQGKQIIYSLGNFCFGGNNRPSDFDTVIYRQTFTLNDEGAVEGYDDYRIIPASVSSRDDVNDYCPRILTEAEGDRVLAKFEELRVE